MTKNVIPPYFPFLSLYALYLTFICVLQTIILFSDSFFYTLHSLCIIPLIFFFLSYFLLSPLSSHFLLPSAASLLIFLFPLLLIISSLPPPSLLKPPYNRKDHYAGNLATTGAGHSPVILLRLRTPSSSTPPSPLSSTHSPTRWNNAAPRPRAHSPVVSL